MTSSSSTVADHLQDLDKININIDINAPIQELSTALEALSEVLSSFQQKVKLASKPLFYKDANQRQQQWSLWKDRNPEEAQKLTDAELEVEIKACGIDLAEIHALKVNAIMLVAALPGRWDQNWEDDLSPKMREIFRRRAFKWHEFVVVHLDSKYFVYDPFYVHNEDERQVQVPRSGNRFRVIRATFEKRYTSASKHQTFFGGGDKTEEGDCRKMSLTFVKEFIARAGAEGEKFDIDGLLDSISPGAKWIEKKK